LSSSCGEVRAVPNDEDRVTAGGHRRWMILGVLFLARTVMGFQFQSIASTAPFLIERFGVGYTEIGTLIGLYMLPGVVFALPGGLLGRRFGDRRLCAAGLALMIVGAVVIGAGDRYAAVFIGRLLSGVGAVLFNLVLAKIEPCRVCRRLPLLRGWSHDEASPTVFT
jgi:predicted MFS family arabinose efflux permease